MRLALPLLLSCLCGAAWAEDWTGFRGPRGNGRSGEAEAPRKWSATENIAWKAALPRPGNGSPIVVAGRVLVTSAEDEEGRRRSLLCFDRETGKPLWKRTVEFDKVMPTHETNPYAGSTPASDGERVVVWHGSAGLHCYDLDGRPLWQKDLGEFKHIWGYGTSPVIVGDRVLMHCGPGEQVAMTALSLDDGEVLWSQEEPLEGDGSRNADNKYMGSWSTPVVVERDGRRQAVCTMPTRVVAYDVETGEILWFCMGVRGPKGDLAYSSPLVGEDICIVRGGFQGPSFAVALGGQGDITADRLWRRERNPQNIGSGLLIGDHYYMANAGPGTLECLEARTGEQVWEERAPGTMWGSMVLVGDVAYVTSQQGETILFRPDPAGLKVLEVNAIRERSNGTPAVSDGQLFIRGAAHLWAIGKN